MAIELCSAEAKTTLVVSQPPVVASVLPAMRGVRFIGHQTTTVVQITTARGKGRGEE